MYHDEESIQSDSFPLSSLLQEMIKRL